VDTCHCLSLTTRPEALPLWDTYEPSSPLSCGVCPAPGAERGVAAGGWGWGSREALPWTRHKNTVCFSYPFLKPQIASSSLCHNPSQRAPKYSSNRAIPLRL
jgi:hypothetical protein